MSDFRDLHPIDFNLVNRDLQKMLYIEDDFEQELTLEVRNASGKSMTFDHSDVAVGPDHYHLMLRFRAGTLSDASLAGENPMKLTMISATAWEAYGPERDETNGLDLIYLLYTGTQTTFAHNAIRRLTFESVSAHKEHLPGGTRVELWSKNLAYTQTPELSIEMTRETHLRIARRQQNAFVPAGTILPFGGPEANLPLGFLPCNGEEVEVAKYPALYQAIGKSWGGDDAGMLFNLPDFRGYFMRGWDGGTGNDPNANDRKSKANEVVGDQVGSLQQDELGQHNHSASADHNGHHRHAAVVDRAQGIKGGSSGGDATWQNDDGGGSYHRHTEYDGYHTHTIRVQPFGGTETRPKNASVLYMIKY